MTTQLAMTILRILSFVVLLSLAGSGSLDASSGSVVNASRKVVAMILAENPGMQEQIAEELRQPRTRRSHEEDYVINSGPFTLPYVERLVIDSEDTSRYTYEVRAGLSLIGRLEGVGEVSKVKIPRKLVSGELVKPDPMESIDRDRLIILNGS